MATCQEQSQPRFRCKLVVGLKKAGHLLNSKIPNLDITLLRLKTDGSCYRCYQVSMHSVRTEETWEGIYGHFIGPYQKFRWKVNLGFQEEGPKLAQSS
jgi:hypothetical protein